MALCRRASRRRWAVALGAALALATAVAACKSSTEDAASGEPDAATGSSLDARAAQGDASSSTDAPSDAGRERPHLDATCDARIVECTVTPTQVSPTVNDPLACHAPAYDSYATGMNNEQVEAACNAFCLASNPSYADAGGFVGCNQTALEQALGTGAFHCVCAP